MNHDKSVLISHISLFSRAGRMWNKNTRGMTWVYWSRAGFIKAYIPHIVGYLGNATTQCWECGDFFGSFPEKIDSKGKWMDRGCGDRGYKAYHDSAGFQGREKGDMN